MVVTPSNSISLFPIQQASSFTVADAAPDGQLFAQQFSAAIAQPSTGSTFKSESLQQAQSAVAAPLPQPVIQTVTNLPWGQSIAYAIAPQAQTQGPASTPTSKTAVFQAGTSLLPLTPVIPPAIAASGNGNGNAAAGASGAASTAGSNPSSTATTPASGPLLSTAQALSLPPSQQAINALSAILTSYGVDPSSLGLTYSEQGVDGPTGSWTNKMITANFPSGKSQDYSAELTLRNPTVAAVEIMEMLGRKVMA
jgi:hypothetical protein